MIQRPALLQGEAALKSPEPARTRRRIFNAAGTLTVCSPVETLSLSVLVSGAMHPASQSSEI
jgi:hypothetical protein